MGKILITGSAGFIGSNLSEFLAKRGIETAGYDLRGAPSSDIKDFSLLKEKMEGVDGVVHLAAISRVKWAFEDPLECVKTNVGGTANLLEAVRQSQDKQPWLVFGSSREVFGNAERLPVTEETLRRPINVYGIAKMAGEDLCESFSANYGLSTRALRFSNVYTGKNDRLDRVIPRFILQALKNEDLAINGSGEELFDFTYIGDTIDGIWRCIQEISGSQKLYDDFILSTGRAVSLRELAEMIIRPARSRSTITHTPGRAYAVSKFYAEPAKAKRILGYNPSVSLEDGLRLAIEALS